MVSVPYSPGHLSEGTPGPLSSRRASSGLFAEVKQCRYLSAEESLNKPRYVHETECSTDVQRTRTLSISRSRCFPDTS